MNPTLQPLIDATAWDLLNRRTPYLARAVFEYLQAGRSPVDVLQDIRTSCTDRSLLPLLACAIHGCASGSSPPSDSSDSDPRVRPDRLFSTTVSSPTVPLGRGEGAVVLPLRPRGLASDGLEELRQSIARNRTRGRRRRLLVH